MTEVPNASVDYPGVLLDGIVVADAMAIPFPSAHIPSGTTNEEESSYIQAEKSAVADVCSPSDNLGDDDVEAMRIARVGGDDVACYLPTIRSPGGSLATTTDDDALVTTKVLSLSSPKTGVMAPPIEITGEGGGGAAVIRGLAIKPLPEDGTNDDMTLEGPKDAKRSRILEEESNGNDLDDCLYHLNESISVAIVVQREGEDRVAKMGLNRDDETKRNGNVVYLRLRDAASKAYHALVAYGSSMDLSIEMKNDGRFLSEARRSKLLDVGRNLWMNIRNNPELFNDAIPQDGGAGGDEFATFDGRKNMAATIARTVAGGYIRAIAARLVFLNYIDTRCGIGRPPKLHDPNSVQGDSARSSPSPQELVFGVKLFSRSGRAILEHDRKGAQGSYDLLTLAACCFDAIAIMASSGSGEAAQRLKDSLDEAFDAMTMLANAASLLGEPKSVGDGDNEHDGVVVPWQTLVLKDLERVESFVNDHCSHSTSKFATLQRFLPSLARLCYKHGGHFVKLRQYEYAGKALHIALKSTNFSLVEIRKELKDGLSRGTQMMHNLEAELVVLSIEAFYLLSVSYQCSGKKDKAIVCLDRVQAYMEEQHARDDELHSQVMTTLGTNEGPINHFEKDASDIINRAKAAREDASTRHAAEKATLAFSRILTFHRTMPCPSAQEESLIDHHVNELLLLLDLSSPTFGSTHHSVTTVNIQSTPKGHGEIFDLALRAIRLVHVRRAISKVVSGDVGEIITTDHYKTLSEKFIKTQTCHRPYIMLDKLNAMLAVEHQVRERPIAARSIGQLENENLELAKEFLATITTFVDAARGNTTLFVASTVSLSDKLFEESTVYFARAVSLHHSMNAHHMCAQWSELLIRILHLKNKTSLSLEGSDVMLGQILAIKAYSQSMSGNHASGMKTAREAWAKVKSVDSIVTLFHCSLRHENKHNSCDTMLELDNALSELLSSSSTDDVLASFPRLSNSCVENEVDGGQMILLGVQERWLDTLLSSFDQRPRESNAATTPEYALFDIFRAYLKHFEHIIALKTNPRQSPLPTPAATARNFEALGRILDGVLNVLVQIRDKKKQTNGRRKKRKGAAEETNAELNGSKPDAAFVLVWDDQTTKKLVGERSDCVWTAEQLWNIGNQLMAFSLGASGTVSGDLRGIAADVFSASHDFCLMSEEEEGKYLSKGFLDYDVKFDPSKAVFPTFHQAEHRAACDISSEFSGQCLLVSAATAVDYAADSMFKSGNGAATSNNDLRILLSRSLHRLAHAQDELQLNCRDDQQRHEVNNMIMILTLRCLIGVGDDCLTFESLHHNGLLLALQKVHLLEFSSSTKETEGGSQSLMNVALMADIAEERKMHQTSRCLHRLCAQVMSQTGKFVLDICDCERSLGEIQKKTIQIATCARDVIDVYDDIDMIVKKHQDVDKNRKDGGFYSMEDLNWFVKDANNRAVEHEILGDDETAAKLFATALNILPLCGREMQQYAHAMNAAYQHVTARMATHGHSLGSIWSLLQNGSH